MLTGLQAAFAAMLEEVRCGSPQSAAEVERALGLDKKLGWQVYRVVSAPNAIAAGFAVPSPVSVRRFAVAARERGASEGTVSRVREAVDRFDQLVRDHAEDRQDFESMIADWSPAGREAVDLLNRRAAFSAMSRLRGSSMATMLTTFIVAPSPDGESVDRVLLTGYLGLRRRRSTIRLGAGTLWYPQTPSGSAERTLANEPITDPGGLLLPEFCSSPTPGFEIVRTDTGLLRFWIRSSDVGTRSAIDYVFASRRDRCSMRYRSPQSPAMIHFMIPSTPTRRLVMDCIVHEDLGPPVDPQILVHDVAGNGPVGTHAEFPVRTADLLDWRPPVLSMGQGLDRFRAPWVPRYVDMLRRLHETTGWNPERFRGYRVEIECPVPSWQISMVFEKYEPPAES